MEALKTIEQLWTEKNSDYLVVKKSIWNTDYCFLVRFIENNKAFGDTYLRNESGIYEIYRKNVQLRIDEAEYYAIKIRPPKSKPVNNEKEDNNVALPSQITLHSRIPYTKKDCLERLKSNRRIKVGSLVTIKHLSTNEIKELRIVPSYDVARYKTMGYKTKNYIEYTRVSDADGVSTISDLSSIGKALLNKHVGEKAEYEGKDSIQRYIILSIK